MEVKRRKKRVLSHREGTLGIPGLPKVTVLGGLPSSTPMIKGKRISKLIKDETSPSWDDVVKTFEGSR